MGRAGFRRHLSSVRDREIGPPRHAAPCLGVSGESGRGCVHVLLAHLCSPQRRPGGKHARRQLESDFTSSLLPGASLLTRRKFLYTGGLATAGAAVVGGVGFAESDRPQVTRINIRLRGLPNEFDGFSIAQLSDFHYEDHFSVVPIRKGVELVNG